MTVAKIHGAEFPIRKIFSDDFYFRIPMYQRPYSWTTEQAGELLDDLLEFVSDDPKTKIEDLSPYFLGSIVVIKEEGRPEAEVVDGQQRLTTLTILLSALRHTIADKKVSSAMTAYLYEEGNPLEGTPNRYRLTIRERDAEFFRAHVQEPDQLSKLRSLNSGQLSDSQRNIRANAVLFLDRLSNLSDPQRMRLGQFIVVNCLLVVVSTPDLDSAYRIFSILNDRGLELSHADILKSEVIGRIPQQEQESYNERWEDAEEDLGREAFGDLFGHTRMIFRKQKMRESILKEFREFVLKAVSGSKALIDDVLIPYTEALSIIGSAGYESTEGVEAVNGLLKWLNRIDNTDWLPPAILFMARHRSDSAALRRFFTDLERLAAFLMVARYGINDRIERYGRLLSLIESDGDLYAADSPLQLSEAERRTFWNELNGEVYRQTAKRRLYVLLRLDSALSDGSASYNYGVISIEHVLPQNPKPGSDWCRWFSTQESRDRWVHRLGNLVLLSHNKNSSAGNYDFAKKKMSYFTKGGVCPFAITTQVLPEAEWTEEVVVRRQADLLRVLDGVWRLDVGSLSQTLDLAPAVDEDDVSGDEDDDAAGDAEGNGRKDYTKFDVTVGGTKYERLAKRQAILKIVSELCRRGVAPEEIAECVPWRTKMFCEADGIVSAEEFLRLRRESVESGGALRFFCSDDELIRSGGRTYALANGWGPRTFTAIRNILDRFPDKGVSCEKSDT